MSRETLLFREHEHYAEIVLNRPELRNAFNEVMIEEMISLCQEVSQREDLAFILLKGEGKSFSAGADLNWMKKMVDYSLEENVQDSLQMSKMFQGLNNLPMPLIGVIHGHALGGGCGLVAVCDFVMAEKNTQFGFTEVNLGLMPAVISPFVMAKIGESQARAYFPTGMRFKAERALLMGLIHEFHDQGNMSAAEEHIIQMLLESGHQAKRKSKELIGLNKYFESSGIHQKVAEEIARQRVSDEGQEGMKALLEKRKPQWAP